MSVDDVVLAIKKALEISYANWKEHGEPTKPDSREASLVIAEAMNAVLQDAIERTTKR